MKYTVVMQTTLYAHAAHKNGDNNCKFLFFFFGSTENCLNRNSLFRAHDSNNRYHLAMRVHNLDG